MRLELGTFPVREIKFGSKTQWSNGLLEVNKDDLIREVRRDHRITEADIDLAGAGESIRITRPRDVIEPRIKVEGPGVAYPGICGRPVSTVGRGKTNRLSGAAVVEVADVVMYHHGFDMEVSGYLDASGPGAEATPYTNVSFLCVVMDVNRSLHIEDQNDALHRAALLVSDRLAETVKDLVPPETEVFELPETDPALPRVVFIPCLRSPEHYSGSLNAHWTAIYGFTRLTPPWPLHPNELLDGAISFCGPNSIMASSSWVWANNAVVHELYRHHGQDLSFAGVIPIRTRWSSMPEKELTTHQVAKIAQMLGASGAIITSDAGGNDYMEVIRAVQACEHIGIDTVFITREEAVTSGSPILEPAIEANAIVSTGISGMGADEPAIQIPPVERVIGKPTLVANQSYPERWDGAPAAVTISEMLDAKGAIPRLAGNDIYGFGRKSGFQY